MKDLSMNSPTFTIDGIDLGGSFSPLQGMKELFDNVASLIPHLQALETSKQDLVMQYMQNYVIEETVPSEISKFRWLDSYYFLKDVEIEDANIVSDFLSKIDDMLDDQNFELCNDLLAEVEIEELNSALMVTLIRTPFIYRGRLTNWIDCRDKIEQCLNDRGIKGKKMLRGLY